MTHQRRYLDVTKVAKLARKALRESFPGVKFSVRCDKYSGGSSMRIRWTDGPNVRQLKAVANVFEGGYFDGMIDYKGQIYHTLDGEPVYFGGDFVFCDRDYSDELTELAIFGLLAKYHENLKTEAPDLLTKSASELRQMFDRGELFNYVLFNGNRATDSVQTLIHQERVKRCPVRYATAQPSKTLGRVKIEGSDGYGRSGIPAKDGVEGKGYPNPDQEPKAIAQYAAMRKQ